MEEDLSGTFYSHLGLYNRPDFGLCKEADRALPPLTVVLQRLDP
jgi:hypothetical protein